VKIYQGSQSLLKVGQKCQALYTKT